MVGLRCGIQAALSFENMIMSSKTEWKINSFQQCIYRLNVRKVWSNTLQVLLLICDRYLATLSRASISGGGIIKHAPGRVLTTPLSVSSSQFLESVLDFRVSLSPRLTISYDEKENVILLIWRTA